MSTEAAESVEYDEESDILYVRLLASPISWSKPIDDLRVVDFAQDGRIIGVEFIDVSQGLDLTDIPLRQRIEPLIRNSGLRFTLPT